ncbi:MAG: ABC transporter ATP-binding protein [Alphaproteobacteria bacterium]
MDTFKKYSFPDADAASENDDYFTPVPEDYDDDATFIDDDILDDHIDEDDIGDLTEDIQNEEDMRAEGNLLLLVRSLNKDYIQGSNKLKILNNVDLRLYSGEISALIGPSGSGKSTLLQILGLLDAPTSGKIMIGERDISSLRDKARTKLRNEYIGFVYQFHHLLPEFSALENVALPQIISGVKKKDAEDKAADLLEQLGLDHRLKHRPATLSGGEQQRVAIARALINDPYLLFADEPTGNLDPETSEEVFEILLKQVRNRGIGALIATHNMELANEMDRVLEVKSGRVLPY